MASVGSGRKREEGRREGNGRKRQCMARRDRERSGKGAQDLISH